MIDQTLIDNMELDSISDGYDELREADHMFLVDEEIEDLSDAQNDLLYGGVNETGRLIDISEFIAEDELNEMGAINQSGTLANRLVNSYQNKINNKTSEAKNYLRDNMSQSSNPSVVNNYNQQLNTARNMSGRLADVQNRGIQHNSFLNKAKRFGGRMMNKFS